MSEKKSIYAVIRVRGDVHVRTTIKDTLKHLRLNRVHHCVLIPDSENYKGMLTKINDYVTWGEISKTQLKKLLKKRGLVSGSVLLNEEYLKNNSNFNSIDEFTDLLLVGEASLGDVKNLKPVFRLNPPVGGHASGGIKKPYKKKGALGYRGKEINTLLEAMI